MKHKKEITASEEIKQEAVSEIAEKSEEQPEAAVADNATEAEQKQEVSKDVEVQDVSIRTPSKKQETTYEYSSNYLSSIEDARVEFLKKYKVQNIMKWVVSIVCLGLVVFCWVGLTNIITDKNVALTVAIVVSVLTIIIVFMYSFLVKKMLNKKMKAYFAMYYGNVTKYVFDGENFAKVDLQVDGKIEKIQFVENDLFADIYEVGSRGLVSFEYKHVPMQICDCAGQIKAQKSMQPVFVGKYLIAPSTYDDENAIFIYIKGDERGIPPTNMESVKNVFDDKKMAIYSNNSKWSKTINTKVKKALGAFRTGKDLIDISISIQKGHVSICLGYDDPLMVLPLEHPFNPWPNTTYKHDLPLVCDFVIELNQ